MSFVTTARLYRGKSRRLSRSTSAVFPEPTGPAMPTRNARDELCFSISLTPETRAYPANVLAMATGARTHHELWWHCGASEALPGWDTPRSGGGSLAFVRDF